MLTTDLLRVRTYKGEIRPRYLDTSDPEVRELARQLIEVFREHVGRSRGELEDELKDLLGTGTAFLLHRGLAKLLSDRSTFEARAPREPAEIRRAVFAAAAREWRREEEGDSADRPPFDRAGALAAAAEELELGADEVEASLYADLKSEEVLTEWEEIEVDALLERYNTALAQAVLLRASELTVELEPQPARRAEALFRRIKFFQLVHRIRPRSGGGWTVHLDGPMSLFKSSQRYGLQMASFLPTLLHLDGWELTAELAWGKKRVARTFRLASGGPLKPRGHLPGAWLPEELRRFPEDFEKLDSGWTVEAGGNLQTLGEQGVLAPDFSFEHTETGTRAVMEVLGFWNRGSAAKRLALLRRYGPANLVLAVSKSLAAGEHELPEEETEDGRRSEIYVFRSFPLARRVLERLEAFLPDG